MERYLQINLTCKELGWLCELEYVELNMEFARKLVRKSVLFVC